MIQLESWIFYKVIQMPNPESWILNSNPESWIFYKVAILNTFLKISFNKDFTIFKDKFRYF